MKKRQDCWRDRRQLPLDSHVKAKTLNLQLTCVRKLSCFLYTLLFEPVHLTGMLGSARLAIGVQPIMSIRFRTEVALCHPFATNRTPLLSLRNGKGNHVQAARYRPVERTWLSANYAAADDFGIGGGYISVLILKILWYPEGFGALQRDVIDQREEIILNNVIG
jgi:hypothetical protein